MQSRIHSDRGSDLVESGSMPTGSPSKSVSENTMLDHLKTFIVAAEHPSFSSAAAALGLPVSTVSRRVSELESQLGAELFHRSNKGLTLTNTGETYFQECAGFIKELDTRITNLHNSINSLSGSLTVVAPINIGSGPLDEFWKQFVARHPQIALNVQLVDLPGRYWHSVWRTSEFCAGSKTDWKYHTRTGGSSRTGGNAPAADRRTSNLPQYRHGTFQRLGLTERHIRSQNPQAASAYQQ